jgi:multisubunit Na+/H+ antiporter MnhG subunit
MDSPDQPRAESPIVVRAVLCGVLALAFAATFAPVGLGGLVRHFDKDLRLPLPDVKTSLALFYPALGVLLFFCARQKTTRRFALFYLSLLALVIVNLAGCFVASTHM